MDSSSFTNEAYHGVLVIEKKNYARTRWRLSSNGKTQGFGVKFQINGEGYSTRTDIT